MLSALSSLLLASLSSLAAAQYGSSSVCSYTEETFQVSTVQDVYYPLNITNKAITPAGNASCTSIFSYRNFDVKTRYSHATSVLLIPNICEGPSILGQIPYIHVDSMVAQGFYLQDSYNNRSVVFILPYLRPGRPPLAVRVVNGTTPEFIPLQGYLSLSTEPPPDDVPLSSRGSNALLLSTSYNGTNWGYLLSNGSTVNARVYASLRRVNQTCLAATPGQGDCTSVIFNYPLPNAILTPGSSFYTNFSYVLSFLNASVVAEGFPAVNSTADTIFVNVLPTVFQSSISSNTTKITYIPQLIDRFMYETTFSAAALGNVTTYDTDTSYYACPWLIEYSARGIWSNYYEELPSYGSFCCAYGTAELASCSQYSTTPLNGLDSRCKTYNTCRLNATAIVDNSTLCRETTCSRQFLNDLNYQSASYCNGSDTTACLAHVRRLRNWLIAQNFVSYAAGYCVARPRRNCTSNRAIAYITGDPHYTTFDGLKYTEFGPGNVDYLALRAFPDDAAELQLQLRTVRWWDTTRTATMATAYALKAGKEGDTVELYNIPKSSTPLLLYINGVKMSVGLKGSYPFKGGVIYRTTSLSYYFIDTDSGFSFSFQAYGTAPWIYETKIWAPSDAKERGGISGLLGNADGNATASNEYRYRNGTVAKTQSLFHENWRVLSNETLIAPTEIIGLRISARSIIPDWDLQPHELSNIQRRHIENDREYHRRQASSDQPVGVSGISSSNRSLEYCLSLVPSDVLASATKMTSIRTECSALPEDVQCSCAYDYGVAFSSNDTSDTTHILTATQASVVTTEVANGGVVNVTVYASNSTALVKWAYENKLAIGARVSIQQLPGVGGWKNYEVGNAATSFLFPDALNANSSYEVRVQAIYEVVLDTTSAAGTPVRRSVETTQFTGGAASAPFTTTVHSVDLSSVENTDGSTTGSTGDNGNTSSPSSFPTVLVAAVVGAVGGAAIIAGVVAGVVIHQKKKAKGLHVSSINSLQQSDRFM